MTCWNIEVLCSGIRNDEKKNGISTIHRVQWMNNNNLKWSQLEHWISWILKWNEFNYRRIIVQMHQASNTHYQCISRIVRKERQGNWKFHLNLFMFQSCRASVGIRIKLHTAERTATEIIHYDNNYIEMVWMSAITNPKTRQFNALTFWAPTESILLF